MRRIFTTFLIGCMVMLPVMGATIPRQSPEFGFEVPGGKQVLLSQYKGKVVVIEFLLTTCPHCQKASQEIEKLYKELGPQGFQPVGVAINDMAKMLVGDFTKKFNLSFPVGYSLRDPVYNYLQHSAAMQLYMPAIVIIDRNGQIVGQHLGGTPIFENLEAGLRKEIEPLLKAKPGASASPIKKSAVPPKVSKKTS